MTESDWAKLALDISSYGDHDDDCETRFGHRCSCGYSLVSRRLVDAAQAVVDRAKVAGAGS